MDGCILRMDAGLTKVFGVPVLKKRNLRCFPVRFTFFWEKMERVNPTLIKILSSAYGREGEDIQLDGRGAGAYDAEGGFGRRYQRDLPGI